MKNKEINIFFLLNLITSVIYYTFLPIFVVKNSHYE